MSSPTTDITPDPTLSGRLFLLLRAVLKNGTATTDDALLVGERHGRRSGNPKLLGAATAEAHRRGWVEPIPAADIPARLARQSARTARASGSVTLWRATATTRAALEMLKRRLTTPPKQPGLFDDCD